MEALSGTDALAVMNSRNNYGYGYGMDGGYGCWFWVIILLLFGRGNWGDNNQTLTSEEFIKRDIFNTNQNVSTTSCQTQRDVLENRYTNQLGFANLGSQVQQCCCDTQKEILQNRYDNALQTQTLSSQMAQCCCDLRAEGVANTQKILDKLCENEINQLRTDLQSAQLQISQLSQTANIIGTLRPYPQPAYITCSPYESTLCGRFGFNGCGCGNNVII